MTRPLLAAWTLLAGAVTGWLLLLVWARGGDPFTFMVLWSLAAVWCVVDVVWVRRS